MPDNTRRGNFSSHGTRTTGLALSAGLSAFNQKGILTSYSRPRLRLP
jgi:hypothetical protein